MTEQDVTVFIEAVMNYFEQVSNDRAEVDTPYLRGSEDVALDFTGVIGISGPQRGVVLFTSDADQLTALLRGMGEPDLSFDNLGDLCGEVANTIAGNARRVFGGDFVISVPAVLWGERGRNALPQYEKSFVVPITWRQYQSRLVISLESTSKTSAN